jgi:hypothetical protein
VRWFKKNYRGAQDDGEKKDGYHKMDEKDSIVGFKKLIGKESLFHVL